MLQPLLINLARLCSVDKNVAGLVPRLQLRARARPGASSAFPKSDRDEPEKSCSDARRRRSTRCAACPDRLTRKARRRFRVSVPTRVPS